MDTTLILEGVRFAVFRLWLWKMKIRRNIWNKRLKLWWHRLWIRRSEFHNSLSIDPFALTAMNEKERGEYIDNLIRRRQTAHQKDMNKGGAHD